VTTEDLLRELAPQVLGAVMRRYGNFADAEDATQEALIAAAATWPRDGRPDDPLAWLIRVAARRMANQFRGDEARRRRELLAASWSMTPPEPAPVRDDTLILMFMCCHPSLTPASAIPLTLRAVGGLTTREIAAAFLVPEATMAQRISRAKAKIKASGERFALPAPGQRPERLRSVLHVLYLLFNEGYTSSSGPDLARTDLSGEAIRLGRSVNSALPDDPEVAGLLAVMLLTDARRPARTGADGEQAASHAGTDWATILTLYGQLEVMTGNPMVRLNRAVAAAMAHGPGEGLALLSDLGGQLGDHHRLHAVRGHLLEQAGDRPAAIAEFRAAAARATNLREQQYLTTQAARLGAGPG
jgi:RNA polymerase sigma factor (sigma-70 family)